MNIGASNRLTPPTTPARTSEPSSNPTKAVENKPDRDALDRTRTQGIVDLIDPRHAPRLKEAAVTARVEGDFSQGTLRNIVESTGLRVSSMFLGTAGLATLSLVSGGKGTYAILQEGGREPVQMSVRELDRSRMRTDLPDGREVEFRKESEHRPLFVDVKSDNGKSTQIAFRPDGNPLLASYILPTPGGQQRLNYFTEKDGYHNNLSVLEDLPDGGQKNGSQSGLYHNFTDELGYLRSLDSPSVSEMVALRDGVLNQFDDGPKLNP